MRIILEDTPEDQWVRECASSRGLQVEQFVLDVLMTNQVQAVTRPATVVPKQTIEERRRMLDLAIDLARNTPTLDDRPINDILYDEDGLPK